MEQLISTLSTQAFDQPRVIHTVVIFINSGSGGKEGHQLMNTGNQGKQLNQIFSTYMYLFKINDESSRKMGLNFVNTLIKQADVSLNKIIVIAGGGDGTVNWLLTQIIQAKIDFTKLAFGALPLGTGNDFAKNLGWTRVTLFNGMKGLQQFFKDIKQSRFEDFDVWQIEVHHYEGGSIVQVSDGNQIQVSSTPLIKQMTNYFSFGMDARVGYHFDKKRSNFQFLNLLIYCLIGCCNRCKKIPSIQKVVSNMKQDQDSDSDMNLVFNSNSDHLQLKKFRNIVALNINSYMGGVKGIWQNSKQSGIKNKPFQPSSHSDGLLQFMAFKNEWSLGAQRVFSGQARKIAQGNGDFKFEFDKTCSQTYLNFDGQYFKIYKPKTVIIRKSPYFKNNKLKVVRCVQY